MSADLWPAERVTIATKPTDVFEVNLMFARRLLDKALDDWTRAERRAAGASTVEPFYLPEVRWEMVRLARRMLSED